MAKKRANPKKTVKSEPIVVAEERKTIEHELFDWGVRLTARPFHGTENHALMIRSEVVNYKPGRGCEVRITFPAASMQNPLRLLDAQTWGEALTAIIADTRAVQTEMRTAASSTGKKKR